MSNKTKKKIQVVQSGEQYATQVSNVVTLFNQTNKSVMEQIQITQHLLSFLEKVKGVVSEDTFTDAVNRIKVVSERNKVMIAGLNEMRTLAEEPPKYYPYSVERLDAWELSISQIMLTELAENIPANGADIAALTADVQEWAETLPKEKTVEEDTNE